MCLTMTFNKLFVVFLTIIVQTQEKYFNNIDLSYSTDFEVVHPRVVEVFRRNRRDINKNIYFDEENKFKIVELGDWILQLNTNSFFLSNELITEWIFGSSKKRHGVKNCDHNRGFVKGLESTTNVAVTICDSELTGFILVSGAVYFIQPLENSSNLHIIYKSNIVKQSNRPKRSSPTIYKFKEPLQQWEYFNLTGDTMEIDDLELNSSEEIEQIDLLNIHEHYFGNNGSVNWWPEEVNSGEMGYFIDSAWEAQQTKGPGKKPLPWKSPTRWLEIAIAVDHTLIKFHGRRRVEQYVLALMNIVSAIYQDSSLEANIQLVITRMLFYENKKQSVVRPGNARKSLENVNTWNKRLHISLSPGEPRHDIGIWLTRSDIGGPSGYAPVGGVCDPQRSCALNRDEGLTSAFIIAHEMAHILGLSHDGDKKSGNDCGYAASEGSVMAPMVSATFHKFIWSECSKQEFIAKASQWHCIQNPPSDFSETLLNATIHAAFTMDEQCRMEFGDGYELCRSFDIIEPCSHLWCGHVKSPLVCKTKKGPPLEGTECGFDKWCINGYCETVDKRRFGIAPVLHNPQNGGWGKWRNWGACSRSCGTGAQFRSRVCDNPSPSYGGNNCYGLSEDWKVCNIHSCPEPIADIRAQQCLNIIGFLNIRDRRANMTWLPHESEEEELKCQLICMSKETRELFVTGESLIDGTPCSYESSTDICIQGRCQTLGCDRVLHSKAKENVCGICQGHDSDCSSVKSVYEKRIKKVISRVGVIPRNSKNIVVEANATLAFYNNSSATLILKNRMKKKYFLLIPSKSGNAEIIEGARLYYRKNKERHLLWTKGSFLVEIVVLLYAPRSEIHMGLNLSLSFLYYTHKNKYDITSRFRWILGGWGSCSASCGGGRRQKTIACWDEKNNKIVKRKYCSLTLKPNVPSEICNTYSCDFHWVTGEWEPCSVTCGSRGTQSRELYCIPKIVIFSYKNSTSLDKPWRFMVNPTKCAGLRPMSVRPCYRIPCLSHWEYGDWSQCSSICGSGISTRTIRCPPPEGESFFTCGVDPPIQRKICKGPFTKKSHSLCKIKNKKKCNGDISQYCVLPSLSKYCKLRSFKRLCCKACSTFIFFPYSS
ncbi:hypothetical protein FQA39_LY17770 [Lamprigera yunnana]|nr:hypothetical protein FQA39_LY17770 [Lamprigera yunnana]